MKQVIIADESLKLPRGKLSAQVAHASVAGFLTASKKQQKQWIEEGMPKVVLAADTEQEIIEYYEKALEAGLPVQLITDAGRTVIPEGTVTCVGIGPASAEDIDRITGHLKLVK